MWKERQKYNTRSRAVTYVFLVCIAKVRRDTEDKINSEIALRVRLGTQACCTLIALFKSRNTRRLLIPV